MKSILFIAVLMLSFTASAAAPGSEGMGKMKLTKEQREKMAVAHEKMASCLRTDKEMSECREDMVKACKDNLGEECPMGKMGMGMRKKMRMHQEQKSE